MDLHAGSHELPQFLPAQQGVSADRWTEPVADRPDKVKGKTPDIEPIRAAADALTRRHQPARAPRSEMQPKGLLPVQPIQSPLGRGGYRRSPAS